MATRGEVIDSGDRGRASGHRSRSVRHSFLVLHRVTAPLSWDDLDAQGCLEEGAVPDWSSLIVVGPIKRRDGHGHMTLEWTVTVYCRPAEPQVTGPPPGIAPVPVHPAI